MTTTIAIGSSGAGGQLWAPAVGRTFQAFLRNVAPHNAALAVERSCIQILGKGQPPGVPGHRTGLVLGRVQSGKTMSFTGVTALAHDNEFPLVIILAGTKNNLVGQTSSRLSRDLQLGTAHPLRPEWKALWFKATTQNSEVAELLRPALATGTSVGHPTALITLLKRGGANQVIDRLAQTLETMDVSLRRELSRRPVLIIDDEADEASLDASRIGQPPTSTYVAIGRLRTALPSSTYLQYTATPQAVLLLGLGDSLSPDFLHLMEPGTDYCGSKEFFTPPGTARIVREIRQPEADDIRNNILGPDVPASLRVAFLTFICGVACELIATPQDDWPDNRSMLVHPDVRMTLHRRFEDWLRALRDSVSSVLQLPDNDSDLLDLQADLRPILDDIAATTGRPVPDFGLLRDELQSVLTHLAVMRMNADSIEEPVWTQQFALVAVGGNKLQRGYTLNGLTVTWMPRSPGLSQVDTILQRGRFFGYRSDYLDYCRVFLPPDLRRDFEQLVPHEEKLWDALRDHQHEASSLSDWRRLMLLEPRLRPCRSAVVRLPTMRVRFGESPVWFEQGYETESSVTAANRGATREIATFADDFREWPGSATWSDPQRARYRVCSVADLLRWLQATWRVSEDDAVKYGALLFQLGAGLDEHPDELAVIVDMNYRASPRPRRSLGSNRRVVQLRQGRQPRQQYPGDRGLVLPDGDPRFSDAESATVVQLYRLDLGDSSTNVSSSDVPFIAIRPGRELRPGVLVGD